MRMKKEISIIVPIYNGSRYLKRLLDSVAVQDELGIELILVNDGSTDDSLGVIEACRSKLEIAGIAVYLINKKENEGISSARNCGLECARGNFVLFVDQDDWLEYDYVRTLKKKIEERGADLVISGFRKINEKGKILECWQLDEECPFSKYRIIAPWGRIFRRSVIEKYHIRFMDTKISEDMYFNLIFMSHTPRIVIFNYVGYNWFYYRESESHSSWKKMSKKRDPLVVVEKIRKNMGKEGKLRRQDLTYFFLKYLLWYLLYSVRGASQEMAENMYERSFSWLDRYWPEYIEKERSGISVPIGESVKVRFCVSLCMMLKRKGILKKMLMLYRKL